MARRRNPRENYELDECEERNTAQERFKAGFGAASGVVTGILAAMAGLMILMMVACGGCLVIGQMGRH